MTRTVSILILTTNIECNIINVAYTVFRNVRYLVGPICKNTTKRK